MPAKRTPSKSDKPVKVPAIEQLPVVSTPARSAQSVNKHDHSSSDMLHHNTSDDEGANEGADLSSMDNKGLVVFSLRQILTDAGASAAAKASAARTLAEIEGVLGRHASPPKDTSKPLASMTREELEAELAKESAGNA